MLYVGACARRGVLLSRSYKSFSGRYRAARRQGGAGAGVRHPGSACGSAHTSLDRGRPKNAGLKSKPASYLAYQHTSSKSKNRLSGASALLGSPRDVMLA